MPAARSSRDMAYCAPRNDRTRSFAFSRHDLPEVCFSRDPSKIEGAGKAGCSASTRSLACRKKHTSVVATGSPKQSDLPCATVYGLFRALLGDRAFLPPSPADRSTDLTPASGRQDHTALPSATGTFVSRASTSIASPPNVRDDRERPSYRVRTGESVELICPTAQVKYFCEEDWTTQITLSPLMKSSFWRIDFANLKAFVSEMTQGNRTDCPCRTNQLSIDRHDPIRTACSALRVEMS
jgi:hypothetical protein